MAASAILCFRNREFLFAVSICRAQTHHCTKFRQNRSFHCGDIAFFRIFKMAAAAILDLWNREILLVILVQSVETHSTPNFVKIGRLFAKILRFFEFSRWPPPSWIFEIAKFNWLLVSSGWRRSSVPNFVKIGQSVVKILSFFSIYQDGGRPPSWICLGHILYLDNPQWVLRGLCHSA